MRFDDFGKAGIFAQETIAGMDRVRARDFGGRNDRGDVEIALGRRRWPDADRLIGEADVHRVAIGRRMHRDRLDAHFMAGAVDAKRDFAAIGDQQFFYLGHVRR